MQARTKTQPANDEKQAAWQTALGRFGNVANDEVSRRLQMSRSTLTFTVTYRAVSSLIETDGHGTAVLGVAVFAALFVIVSLNSMVKEYGPQDGFPDPVKLRVERFLSLCNDVTVQFISNLIAITLTSTFAEAENVWWVMAFAFIGIALIGHATSPT